MVPPALVNVVPVLLKSPPFVVIALPTATVPPACRVTPSLPALEPIVLLTVMVPAASRVNVASAPPVLEIAPVTVMFPASPLPTLAVSITTLVPPFSDALITPLLTLDESAVITASNGEYVVVPAAGVAGSVSTFALPSAIGSSAIISTLAGSRSHWPALPFGALASAGIPTSR